MAKLSPGVIGKTANVINSLWLKWPFLLKLGYRFNSFSVKIVVGFFEEIDNLILKCVWKGKRTRITNSFFFKRRTRVEDFKKYYTAALIKIVC